MVVWVDGTAWAIGFDLQCRVMFENPLVDFAILHKIGRFFSKAGQRGALLPAPDDPQASFATLVPQPGNEAS
jgi:hypothetical protein